MSETNEIQQVARSGLPGMTCSPSLDTPETNARAAEDKYMECWGEEWSVDADFARKLERERDMARREAEAYRNRWIGDYTIEQTATRFPWESQENTLLDHHDKQTISTQTAVFQ